MPVLNFERNYDSRPLVEVYVTAGTAEQQLLREAGLPIPGAILAIALIDTGASMTHVDLDILHQLGLSSKGEVNVFTVSTGDTPEVMDLYSVNLAFAGDRPGPIAENQMVVGSTRLAGLKIQMLLGREFLDRCLLVYDGPNRRLSLAYDPPSGLAAP